MPTLTKADMVMAAVAAVFPEIIVSVKRNGIAASIALSPAVHNAGQLSLGGLDCDVRTNIRTLVKDFDPPIAVGDVLMVDDVPAFVVNTRTSAGISNALVVPCSDTAEINGVDVPCSIGNLSEDIAASLGGFSPDDMQGFFVPESILPEGVEIAISSQVEIAGKHMTVTGISSDSKHRVLCVTCKRRGDE